MLQLHINNQFIPLDPNISIPFVLNNPMFSTKGSYSFSLSLPWGNEIAAALGYIDKPDKSGLPSKTFTGTLGYQNNNTWQIVGYPKKVTSKNVQLYFRIGLGGFYELTKDQTLQDLNLGGERNIPTPTISLDLQYPENDFTLFPVKNPNYMDNTSWETSFKNAIVYQNFPSGILDPKIETITPFPYVGYVLERIFIENGYDIDETIFRKHSDLKQLCEFYLNDIVRFKIVNQTLPADDLENDKAFLKNHLPELIVSKYLENITNKYNVKFFINEYNNKVKILSGNEIITDPGYIEISDKSSELIAILDEQKYNGFAFIENHDSGDDYLSQFYSPIEDFYSQIVGSVNDISDLNNISTAYINDIFYVINTNSYYQLIFSGDPPEVPLSLVWNFLTLDKFQNYFSSFDLSDLLETETDISSLWTVKHADDRDGTREWKTPVLEQIGNSPYRYDEKLSFGHRHLFYRGIKKDLANNDYPFGSSDNYDFDGNKIGNLTLEYKGEYGLYEQLWKNWLNWKINIARTFENQIMWPEHLLFNFPWEKKFRIRNTNYFVKQIKVNLRYKAPEVGVSEIVKC